MHETAQRLYQAAKELNLNNQAQIARALNTSSQVIKNWESRGISNQGYLEIEETLNISAIWLKTGKGTMYETFRQPNITPPEKGDNFTSAHRQGTRSIPLLGQVEAGAFTEAMQLDEISEWRVSNKKCSSKAFALYVSGYSMHNPTSRESFEPGDIILVDPELPYNNGSLVIAITDEGAATFKKLFIEDGRYYLKALNPEWKPSMQTITKPTQICGVVYEKQVDF